MQLVVQSGSEPGRTYDITASQKIRMGRQSGNDVVVPDEQVSRRHAEIEERNGGLVVTDLGSSNGTFVNGTRITSPQNLMAGDTVQVGTTVLKVVGSSQAGGAADYDQGATQINYKPSSQPSGQDYGSYGSPASPSAPSANDYGQSGGYGQSSSGYGQSSAYGGGSGSSYDQGQNAYGGGSSSSAPSYGGSGSSSSYDQGQNAYGGGQSSGGYGGGASSYDQGQQNAYGNPSGGNAYGGGSSSASSSSYGGSGAGSSYDPANPSAGGYGQQGAYGQQASQSPYGQSGASYDPANPSAGGYGGGAGAYDPANPGAGYGQQGGYNQGQQGYGQQAGQYAQGGYPQAAAAAPAKKGGLPLPILIIGIVVVLVILGVLAFFLFFNKGAGTTVGSDIPAPPNSTKLDISASDIAKLDPTAKQEDISKISYGFYASTDTPASILSFYQTEMKNRGWTQDTTQSDTTGALFKKGDNNTGLGVIPIATDAEVASFETAIPPLKGKLKAGQTLVIVASGPANVFKTTPGA